MPLPQLNRVRWAVRAALALGVAASVIANVLHARHNPISQAIAAWPPLALLLTVELTSRIPMHKWALAACRVLATMAIAGIAAWVSYWHMQDVAFRFGESQVSSYLLPVSVDGLIVVASVSLVELAGRIRFMEDLQAKALVEARAAAAATYAAPLQAAAPAFRPAPQATPATARSPLAELARAEYEAVREQSQEHVLVPAGLASSASLAAAPVSPAVVPMTRSSAPAAPLRQGLPVSPAVSATTRPAPAYVNGTTPPARQNVTRAAVSAPARTIVTAPTTAASDPSAPRQRRPVQETAELADAIEAMHPEIGEPELARQLGISATRLRVVRREAREVHRSSTKR